MTRFRTQIVALSLVSLLGGATALADDYRGEVAGSYGYNNYDDSLIDNTDQWQVRGTYYFEPVKTDGLPLAEAAYLTKAGSVSAVASRFDILDTHLNGAAAAISYYMPDTILYGSLSVSRSENVLVNSQRTFKTHDTSWGATFGVTPLDGLLITTHATEDGWDPNVAARYVHKLPNSHYYAASVSFVDPDVGDTRVAIDFDYFLDLTFKVGAGYADADDRFTLRAEKFFTPRFSVGGEIYKADFTDGFEINAAWRF